MSVKYNPSITTDGIILALDAADVRSYPGSGTAWRDTSGNKNHFTVNASAYNGTGPKYMDFNGSYGCAVTASGVDTIGMTGGTMTAIVWTRIKNSTSDWRTLFRGETSNNDHQVIVQSGGWLIGMYDNTNSTGFNSSGYSQQSLPGYGTSQWNMLVWRWASVQNQNYYYNFSYNNTPSTLQGYNSSGNARFKGGFRTLGAYYAASPSQFWGDIGKITMYNRYLDDAEVLQHWNAHRGRFGV
jgi:hypothetical protein